MIIPDPFSFMQSIQNNLFRPGFSDIIAVTIIPKQYNRK